MPLAPESLVIDHVTVAGSELSHLEAAFKTFSIAPIYGGEHNHNPTHMSMVGFEDETYVELIAKAEAGDVSYWEDAMDHDLGPCAWAIRSDDLEQDINRLESTSVQVDGPHRYSRTRTDGTTIEWSLAFLGSGEPGAVLPFLIEDHTPRSERIQPTPSATRAGLTGIEAVIIAVSNIDSAINRLSTVIADPEPTVESVGSGPLAGDIATFADVPVLLVAPHDHTWLAERIRKHEDGTCGFVFQTDGSETISNTVEDLTWRSLGQHEIAVIDPAAVGGLRYLCVGR